jgi:hypothetical protein
MKGKQEGMLKLFQTIPVLSKLNYCELQRLCMGSKEVQYSKGAIILDINTLSTTSWTIGNI